MPEQAGSQSVDTPPADVQPNSAPILASDPGAVPFVDLSIGSFGDIVSGARSLTATGSWVVRTPLGLLVHGYEQARSILRDQAWISVLAGASVLAERSSQNDRTANATDLPAAFGRASSYSASSRSASSHKADSRSRTQLAPRPNVLSVEGADHHRLRRLVSSAFTPASADRMRPFMADYARQLIDEIITTSKSTSKAGTTSELVADLCRPYPIPIICELLGTPASDWQLFDRWAETILGIFDADTDALLTRVDDIATAQAELDDYVADLIAQRKTQLGDDLLSLLISAHDEDHDEDADAAQLSGSELAAMVEALLLAGTDTTRNQLGATLAAFADHPEQYQLLRQNPDLVPDAIEESLRYLGAVRSTARLATKDIEVEGLLFPAGTTVVVGLHAASLSADSVDDSYRFDITAKRNRPHLAFGSGIHHCLGAFLARAELQEALSQFVERVESFELVEPVEWKPLSLGIWGPARMPVQINPVQTNTGQINPVLINPGQTSTGQTNNATSGAAATPIENPPSRRFSAGTIATNKASATGTAEESVRDFATDFTTNGASAHHADSNSVNSFSEPGLNESDSNEPDFNGRGHSTLPDHKALRDREALHDRYLTRTAPLREKIHSSLPALIKPPRIPPIGRLAITGLLIVWAVFAMRIWDRLFRRSLTDEQQRAHTYRRLRKAAERLGPSYIKLAQLIAAGEGVFPDALVSECRSCRDQVTAMSWTQARRVLQAELGPLHLRFASIDPTPLAAASIAQAHAATLLDGTEVVVKVQRPRISHRVKRDIAVLAWVAPHLVGKIPVTALANPPALVELFAETISEELDFRVEVANLIEVDRALRAQSGRPGRSTQPAWLLPTPHLDAVTKRIIVMSRVKGRPLSSLEAGDLPSEMVTAIFGQMIDSLLEGTCVHGVFHGDFHAGNVLVDDQGNVGLVDFGITGRLQGNRRIAFLRYVIGLLTGDVVAQLEGMAQLGAFSPGVDGTELAAELGLDRPDFDPLKLSEEEFVAEFRSLITGLLTHGARIPKELMLFIKNFAYITSVMGELAPDMDILAQFERTASSFVARNGVRMAGEIGFSVSEDNVTESALRQAMGVSSQEPKVTWRLLRKRRTELTRRISSTPDA